MQRLAKYSHIIESTLSSKSPAFVFTALKLSMKVVAGLYKPASVKLEHGLILSSLTGSLAIAKSQLHGKRQKRTISINADLRNSKVWPALDKIINELLPKISDFRTPKFKKPAGGSYSIKLKQKFTPLPDFEDLVSQDMYDSHRGIFLPLSVHFIILNKSYQQIDETYMRMLRIPFNFYVRRSAPAFDDLAVFQQAF